MTDTDRKSPPDGAAAQGERKPHGDKLASATGTRPALATGDVAASGDSPKRQGDPMAPVLESGGKR